MNNSSIYLLLAIVRLCLCPCISFFIILFLLPRPLDGPGKREGEGEDDAWMDVGWSAKRVIAYGEMVEMVGLVEW
ncbi:MAG: hypothetical protein BYD32DRAFT_402461 [Podila humilis]|nr:MAG: hypothetical protein BYD32DRAFT_402461 [Podila humilis]